MFKTHADIPDEIKQYFLLVSDARKIEEVPLSDINNFITGFTAFNKQRAMEEFEDGWVD